MIEDSLKSSGSNLEKGSLEDSDSDKAVKSK